MKVTVILIVTGVLETISKGLLRVLEELENEGRAETNQTIAFSRLARILRRVLETRGDLLSISEKLSANADVKNSQGVT